MARLLMLALSILGAAALIALEIAFPRIRIAPLYVLPVLVIALAFGRTWGLAASAMLGLTAIAVGHIVSDSALTTETLANAGILAFAYAVAVMLLQLARELSSAVAGYAWEVQNAQIVHDDLFQQALPEPDRWSLAISHLPLHELGGDYYSVSMHGDACHVFVADVSGKGIRAAMLLACLKSVSTIDLGAGASSLSRMRYLNSALLPLCETGMFATAWYGIFEADGTIRFTSAGHERAIVRHSEGDIVELAGGGLPLGIQSDAHLSESTLALREGDAILIHSDGLSELIDEAFITAQELMSDFSQARSKLRGARRRDDLVAFLATRKARISNGAGRRSIISHAPERIAADA